MAATGMTARPNALRCAHIDPHVVLAKSAGDAVPPLGGHRLTTTRGFDRGRGGSDVQRLQAAAKSTLPGSPATGGGLEQSNAVMACGHLLATGLLNGLSANLSLGCSSSSCNWREPRIPLMPLRHSQNSEPSAYAQTTASRCHVLYLVSSLSASVSSSSRRRLRRRVMCSTL